MVNRVWTFPAKRVFESAIKRPAFWAGRTIHNLSFLYVISTETFF